MYVYLNKSEKYVIEISNINLTKEFFKKQVIVFGKYHMFFTRGISVFRHLLYLLFWYVCSCFIFN